MAQSINLVSIFVFSIICVCLEGGVCIMHMEVKEVLMEVDFSPTMWVLVMELRLSDLVTRRLDLLIYLTGPKLFVVLLSICM